MANQTSNNPYNVQPQLWSRLDEQEQRNFNKGYKGMEQRRNEIIQSVSNECRSNLEEHFKEIAATMAVFLLQELHQTAV